MGPLVVLAYSGGLDTSAIVPWLREKYGARVLCFAADVGQGPDELTGLVEKAKRSGAVDCVVQDLREEFVRDFVFPTLRAGAVYARTYLLGTAMARPVMAAHHVALAQRVDAQALAHGCTGKGNDQVRFELTYAALAPELQVIAPWREWQFKGREDLIAYVKAKGVPGQATLEKPYSPDRNPWHCSHETGILEAPAPETPEREALDAAVASTQTRVTGAVRLKLFKGGFTVAGRESPYALYQPSYATFGKDNVYDQKDAQSFIHLYGLSIRIGSGLEAARRQQEVGAAAD